MKENGGINLLVAFEQDKLFVEFSKSLEDAGLNVNIYFASTFTSFSECVENSQIDVILLHGYNRQLTPGLISPYRKKENVFIPVIFVADKNQEDFAIKMLPDLIDDYLILPDIKRISLSVTKANEIFRLRKIAENAEINNADSATNAEGFKNEEQQFSVIFRQLADLVPSGIFQADIHGGICYVNANWCRLSGLTPTQSLNNGWLNAIHHEDSVHVFNEWNLNLQQNTSWTTEFRFLNADGETSWVSMTVIPLSDPQHIYAGWLGCVSDISNNKHFEEALSESESRLEAAQELAKAGDWNYDIKSDSTSWSADMFSLFERDQLKGPPDFSEFLEMIHPDDRDKIILFQKYVFEYGHHIGEDYRILLKDGNVRHVYPTAYCMYDTNGQPVKITGTLVDVTERVKSHEAIKRNEQLIDTLFSKSPEGMYMIRLNEPLAWNEHADKNAVIDIIFHKSRVTRINQTFAELYAVTKEFVTGLTPHEFFTSVDMPVDYNFWKEVFETGQGGKEFFLKKAEENGYWLQEVYICIHDNKGRITGYIGLQKNVTREKYAAQEIKYSERNFREIFENSPDGIYIEDYNGVILDLNDEACRMQHQDRENLIGKNIIDITPYPQKEEILSNFKKFVDGSIDRLESFSWDSEWNPVPVEIKVNRIVFSGKPAILLHVRDMRVKKIMSPDSYLDTEAVLKNAGAGIWEWNIKTGEFKSSGVIDFILGYEKNEINKLNLSWFTLIHTEEKFAVEKNMKNFRSRNNDQWQMEFRMLSKSGEYKWIIMRGKISENDTNGNPSKISGIIIATNKNSVAGSSFTSSRPVK